MHSKIKYAGELYSGLTGLFNWCLDLVFYPEKDPVELEASWTSGMVGKIFLIHANYLVLGQGWADMHDL